MKMSKAGMALKFPRKNFDADEVSDAVRRIARENNCAILGDSLPAVLHRGKVMERKAVTWAFPRGTNVFVFLLADKSGQQVDPTKLPVNSMTMKRLTGNAA